jgi:hypothetical protein
MTSSRWSTSWRRQPGTPPLYSVYVSVYVSYIGVVCGIDVDVVSQYMVYMVYNCVYYCDTCTPHHGGGSQVHTHTHPLKHILMPIKPPYTPIKPPLYDLYLLNPTHIHPIYLLNPPIYTYTHPHTHRHRSVGQTAMNERSSRSHRYTPLCMYVCVYVMCVCVYVIYVCMCVWIIVIHEWEVIQITQVLKPIFIPIKPPYTPITPNTPIKTHTIHT